MCLQSGSDVCEIDLQMWYSRSKRSARVEILAKTGRPPSFGGVPVSLPSSLVGRGNEGPERRRGELLVEFGFVVSEEEAVDSPSGSTSHTPNMYQLSWL
jgi:hypothetical protein